MASVADNDLSRGIRGAVVSSYDPATRKCFVTMEGSKRGEADLLAEIMYPIGDRPNGTDPTEIRILPGDKVWVMFINNDPRYPLIMGYRTPQTGNVNGTRRFAHQNAHFNINDLFKVDAGTLTVNASHINFNGTVAITGSGVTHNGKNIGDTHTHGGVDTGSGSTAPPN